MLCQSLVVNDVQNGSWVSIYRPERLGLVLERTPLLVALEELALGGSRMVDDAFNAMVCKLEE